MPPKPSKRGQLLDLLENPGRVLMSGFQFRSRSQQRSRSPKPPTLNGASQPDTRSSPPPPTSTAAPAASKYQAHSSNVHSVPDVHASKSRVTQPTTLATASFSATSQPLRGSTPSQTIALTYDQLPTKPLLPSAKLEERPRVDFEQDSTSDKDTPIAVPSPSQTPNTSQGSDQTRTWGLATLKASLTMLAKAASAVPSLKLVIELLAGCVEAVPNAAKRHRDYQELATSITASVKTLERHFNQFTPTYMAEPLENIVVELHKELERIIEKQGRTSAERLFDAEQDLEDLVERYRHIDWLFQQLQSNAMLDIWRKTHDTLGVAKKSLDTANITLDVTNEHLYNTRLEEMQPAKEARYDFGTKEVRRHGCTPNTRTLVLQNLLAWANCVTEPKVYWMNGMAGTGKTTIAYTFCQTLKTANQLGASFFCSRQLPGCRDTARIVPTLAYQLARRSLAFRSALCRTLAIDPDICSTSIADQFENLINIPMLEVEQAVRADNLVIVIDALDECSDHTGEQNILDALFRFAVKLPVKFFVTCRPEHGLVRKALSGEKVVRSIFHLHDIEQSLVEADIETYLRTELTSISLSEREINQLAKQSGKLFIYAATAVRYLQPDTTSCASRKRLDIILGAATQSSSKAYQPLDELYTIILSAALEDPELEPWEAENIKLVLYTVLCAREPMSTNTLACLLRLEDSNEARIAIEPLRSVLYESETSSLVSILHSSFPDYMHDPQRSREFWCDRASHNATLALRCFETMKNSLRFNICSLDSPFSLDNSLPDLQSRAERAIPPHLFYACKYWTGHLTRASNVSDLTPMIEDFLQKRVLFWMEAMSLKKCVGLCTLMISEAYSWMKNSRLPDCLCAICLDAQKFATVVGSNAVCNSTPHIYLSVLALWGRDSAMWTHYGSQASMPVEIEGLAIYNRPSTSLGIWKTGSDVTSAAVSRDGRRIICSSTHHALHVWDTYTGALLAGPFIGHVNEVTSVAFSPDGSRIASGSADGTIYIWDIHTSQVLDIPFQGHKLPVNSLTFLPDNDRIASGSADRTICIWDVVTGKIVVGPLKAHTDCVRSLACSPDGCRLFSSSDDGTIRIWDAQTGRNIAGPLEGHSDSVYVVALSCDGHRIVTGSSDKTIRVWDAQTGDATSVVFKGHTDLVTSVAFHPDGSRIVSGSDDGTVRVWDTQTGCSLGNQYNGHAGSVTVVAYSSDGRQILSGSEDGIFRIWDAQTEQVRLGASAESARPPVLSVHFSPEGGQIVGGYDDGTICIWDPHINGTIPTASFKAHLRHVLSVAFSPNGTHIASGSDDYKIRIWDTPSNRTVVGPLKGHTGVVNSIAYSPNGSRIVSGSCDHTICIWDTETGQAVGDLLRGHSDRVRFVAYSSDGNRIVSGSNDKTIRLWDAWTGHTLAGPLEGHTGSVLS
ncbi:hypothetical protein FRC07_002715, partial [Ceratobasidium sp. 392]